MALPDELKLIGIAIALASPLIKWLRSHNDRTLGPPAHAPNDAEIEQLVRRGRTVEAIRAIRARYGYSLQQAKEHYDAIKVRQAGR